ncbi:uncharacterized protein LOC128989858 isoform X1 [Macrosteles quadrilineatus]|uniref:uncharacterized protein LOC128989858 isoform X1 n=2 Tax=Macrosteles quadrilineatus TaxID=74068 RepID=UPI0023E1833B|nr:uncharacterized protein LOC128989858 isoform X1 [Macrosteles quadrilineatus]
MESHPQEMSFVRSYDDFAARLNEHEITTHTKYILEKSYKNFSAGRVYPTTEQRVHWLKDIPYYLFSTRTYYCHQGRDKNKSFKMKYKAKRDKMALEDHSFVKRYKQTYVTKKLDCPAKFHVSRVIMMPEHKFHESVSRSYQKTKFSTVLRRKIENGESLGEEGFIFNLPTIQQHANHLTGESAAFTEPVDRRVRAYIDELVIRGERNAVVISKLLKSYVQNELQQKDELRRRFYPNMKTIRKLVSSSKLKLRKSPIFQQNTNLLVESLNNNDLVCFRPSTPENTMENAENSSLQYEELPKQSSKRMKLTNKNNALLKSLQSMLQYLGVNMLENLHNSLEELINKYSSRIKSVKINRLPVEVKANTCVKEKKLELGEKERTDGVCLLADNMKESQQLVFEDDICVLVSGKVPM